MSGKKTKARRKTSATPASIVASAPRALELVKPTVVLKLDLAAGQNVREGFEGVDIFEGSTHVMDLLRFPWPWADNSVDELHCSHFVEHLPMEFVDEHGNYVPCGTPGAKDMFFKFFDECWRILKPGGWFTVIVPCLRNNRAFQDPTHRRFLPAEAFFYLFKNFRDVNKLNHYNVQCNYEGSINPTVSQDMNLRSQEVQTRMFNESWNAIADWHVKLQALK